MTVINEERLHKIIKESLIRVTKESKGDMSKIEMNVIKNRLRDIIGDSADFHEDEDPKDFQDRRETVEKNINYYEKHCDPQKQAINKNYADMNTKIREWMIRVHPLEFQTLDIKDITFRQLNDQLKKHPNKTIGDMIGGLDSSPTETISCKLLQILNHRCGDSTEDGLKNCRIFYYNDSFGWGKEQSKYYPNVIVKP